jgi:hypothetical protein
MVVTDTDEPSILLWYKFNYAHKIVMVQASRIFWEKERSLLLKALWDGYILQMCKIIIIFHCIILQSVNLSRPLKMNLAKGTKVNMSKPGSCTIKLFTAVIYGFS